MRFTKTEKKEGRKQAVFSSASTLSCEFFIFYLFSLCFAKVEAESRKKRPHLSQHAISEFRQYIRSKLRSTQKVDDSSRERGGGV